MYEAEVMDLTCGDLEGIGEYFTKQYRIRNRPNGQVIWDGLYDESSDTITTTCGHLPRELDDHMVVEILDQDGDILGDDITYDEDDNPTYWVVAPNQEIMYLRFIRAWSY